MPAEVRAEKINALQKQAASNQKPANNNVVDAAQKRRDVLNVQMELKKRYEEQARQRGILPPDERPVKYNNKKIGITQALNDIG